jgi:drug/metabolite transporter superfamily protein YnfA
MVGAIVVFAVIALVDVAGCHDLYDGLCSLVSVLVSLAPFINLVTIHFVRPSLLIDCISYLLKEMYDCTVNR